MITLDLTGRNALVTGGSRGIGSACCRLLSRAGARVGVHYHSARDAAEALVQELGGKEKRAEAFRADISSEAEVTDLFQEFEDRLGHVDILVTSAGIWKTAPLRELSETALDEMVRVNLHGTIFCCREAARRMKARGGTIVTISSTAGQRGEAAHSHYAATKGGVQSLTKSLAVELAPEIRINCVAPGWVETDMTRSALSSAEGRRRIESEIPLGRIASPEDIAGAALFLCSDLARHIQGEILNVNGGSVLCG